MISNIFYFHPYLGKWSNLTNIFEMGWNHQLDILIPWILWVLLFSFLVFFRVRVRTKPWQVEGHGLHVEADYFTNKSPEDPGGVNNLGGSRLFLWAIFLRRFPPVGHPKWWFNKGTSPKSPKHSGLGIILIWSNLPRFMSHGNPSYGT